MSSEDLERIGKRRSPQGAVPRIVALILVLLSVFLTVQLADLGGGGGVTPRGDPLAGIPEGWSRLPDPPEVRDGAAFTWAGDTLIAWGGCDPVQHSDCVPTRDGFAFDPVTRGWRTIPEAPLAGTDADVVWTGSEAIFLVSPDEQHLGGQAYRPSTGNWRRIAEPPLRPQWGDVEVWTGDEIIVWGGGQPDSHAATNGAAYDPDSDMWRRIATAPLGLNAASGVWTGREVLVFGSLLDARNWAETKTSVGAAYDPAADSWRELPPSELSTQASSADWVGDRLVAWDYEVHSQEYDPARDAWDPPIRMPLEFSECYPASSVLGDLVFAFFCGRAALYDPGADVWTEIRGGPLDEEVWSKAYESNIKVWRFGYLVPAGDVLFFPAQGLTLTHRGEACYGCEGSPDSFWSYRPSARA